MRLGDNNFVNLFRRIVSQSNSDRDCDEWRVSGATFARQRFVNWTSGLSFQIETWHLHHAARPSWTLFVVHEMWWGENRDKTIRNQHWVRLESGEQKNVLKWFKEREEELDPS